MAVTFEIKACSKCGEAKKLTQFSKKKGAHDGRHSACIVCENTRVREAYYQGTLEQQAERREAKVEANRLYLQKNPEKQKQYQQNRVIKIKQLEQRIDSLEQRITTLEK